jgi:hypothetical protein
MLVARTFASDGSLLICLTQKPELFKSQAYSLRKPGRILAVRLRVLISAQVAAPPSVGHLFRRVRHSLLRAYADL